MAACSASPPSPVGRGPGPSLAASSWWCSGRVWRSPRPSRLAEALAIAVWWLATAAYLYWTRSGLWILGVATTVFLLSCTVRYARSSPPPEAQELHPGERELERMRPRIP